MKLQKLVYYAQVWASVDGKPLFSESVKAWERGPVVPSLFVEHKGRVWIESNMIGGDSEVVGAPDRERIDRVLTGACRPSISAAFPITNYRGGKRASARSRIHGWPVRATLEDGAAR